MLGCKKDIQSSILLPVASSFLAILFLLGFQSAEASVRLPEPVSYREVTLPLGASEVLVGDKIEKNQSVTFTDCMEISLLRILQAFLVKFDDVSEIDRDVLQEKIPEGELRDFFMKYPKVISQDNFRKTELGIEMRTRWAALLARRTGFDYKLLGQLELTASVNNIIAFADLFLRRESSPDRFKLQDFCSYFDRKGMGLRCELSVDSESSLEHTARTSQVEVYFNGKQMYRWDITERFVAGVRESGHSQVYRSDPELSFDLAD